FSGGDPFFQGGGLAYQGMPTGVLAIGLTDAFPSSFSNGSANAIAVRGAGPATPFLGGAVLSPTPDTPARGLFPTDPNFRQLTITLPPIAPGSMSLTVQLQAGTVTTTVLSNLVVSGLPQNVGFGLSAAIGAALANHEIRNFSLINGIPDLSLAVPT